jgi:hypothetical protein
VGFQQRNPTSDVAFSGTWTGTPGSRYTLVDDWPDSGNPIADGLTHGNTAGQGLFGFTPFTIPSDAHSIVLTIHYYDFKNGSQAANLRARIRCNDTTGRDGPGGTHNPGNGNANIAARSDNYGTNPKTGVSWTPDEINGIGTNALTAFGVVSTDANPNIVLSSIYAQVDYQSPSENPPAEIDEFYPAALAPVIQGTRRWPYTAGARDMLPRAIAATQNVSWFQQHPDPKFPSRFSAAQLQAACVRVSFSLPINPAMWTGVYPNYIHRRPPNYSQNVDNFWANFAIAPGAGNEDAPPWGQDQSYIRAYRRFLYQSFSGPVVIIENDPDTSVTFEGQDNSQGGGVIASVQRWPYQPGAPLVLGPSTPAGTVEEISKWLGQYPDFIVRDVQHPAYTPYQSVANLDPLGSPVEWWFPQQVDQYDLNRRYHAARYQQASTDIPYLDEVKLEKWLGFHPSQLFAKGRAFPWLVTGPIEPPTVDFKLGWLSQHPIWIAGKQSTVNIVPAWVGTYVPRPDIHYLQWVAKYPDFAREIRRHPELWQSYFGPEAVLPNDAQDIDYFTWFIENVDFARGAIRTNHLLPAHVWNNLHGLPNPSGHIVWYKRRRRP